MVTTARVAPVIAGNTEILDNMTAEERAKDRAARTAGVVSGLTSPPLPFNTVRAATGRD